MENLRPFVKKRGTEVLQTSLHRPRHSRPRSVTGSCCGSQTPHQTAPAVTSALYSPVETRQEWRMYGFSCV